MRIRRGAERTGHAGRPPRVGAVLVLSLLAAVAAWPEPEQGFGLGYAFMPELPFGATVAVYDLVWGLGLETMVNYRETVDEPERDRRFGWSIGVNVRTPVEGLYPSLGVAVMTRRHTRSRLVDQEPCKLIYHGEPHCPRTPTTDVLDEYERWGGEVKLTYATPWWVAVTLGYRALFVEPFEGSVVVGLSVVMRPPPVPTTDRE